MKQVLVWTLILVAVFALLIGLAFVGLTMMTPEPDELEAMKQASQQAPQPSQTDSSATVPNQPEKQPGFTDVNYNPM